MFTQMCFSWAFVEALCAMFVMDCTYSKSTKVQTLDSHRYSTVCGVVRIQTTARAYIESARVKKLKLSIFSSLAGPLPL